MSLVLGHGTKPRGLEVKIHGLPSLSKRVFLGDYDISLGDFLAVAEYVLTNTDLRPRDPRRRFVRRVRSMREVDGYNPGGRRLEPSGDAVRQRKMRV